MKKMIKCALALVLISVTSLALAAGETAISGKFLGIFQNTGLPDSSYATSFEARIGTVKFNENDGLNLTERSNVVPTAGRLGAIPYYSYTVPQPTSVILAEAKLYQMSAVGGSFISDLKNFQKATSATDVSFTYRQRVIVQGNPVPKFLTWRLILDSLGKVRYTTPKIVPTTPTFVQIEYTPLKLEAGLPTGWAYPNAGKYTYRLIDKDKNPVTGLTVVNTSGAFDEPAPAIPPATQPAGCVLETGDTEASCDPDFALHCLADKTYNAACPTAYKDGIALMDEMGADGIYIDYKRKIQPLYKGKCESGVVYNESEGTCADGTDPVEVAQVVIDIKKRLLTQSSCLPKAVYDNDIDIGYKLQYQVDHYSFNLEEGMIQTGTESVISLSPTQALSLTLPIYPVPSNISETIIDPTNPLTLIKIADFADPADIINIAPLQRTFEANKTYTFNDAYPSALVNGGMGTQWVKINVECVAGTIAVRYSAKQGANADSWLNPGVSGPAMFTVGAAGSASTGWYAAVKRISMDASTTFCYDGIDTISLCASPQWDGLPGKDELNAVSPPPRGVAWCPAGSTVGHNFTAPAWVTTPCTGIYCFNNTTYYPQTSYLSCNMPPPSGYGACVAVFTQTSPCSGWGCQCSGGAFGMPQVCTSTTTYRLSSQTASTCIYNGSTSLPKPFTCPTGWYKNGTACSNNNVQFYIKLN